MLISSFQLPNANHHMTSDTSTTLQDDSISTKDHPSTESKTTFSPLTIRIIYTLDTPRNGIAFVEPDINAAPYVSFLLHWLNWRTFG